MLQGHFRARSFLWAKLGAQDSYGLPMGNIRVILGLYGDDGEENGSYRHYMEVI